MYSHVTQFETRDQLILDELRVQEERRRARLPSSRTRRATVLPIRLARMLKLDPPRRHTGQSADPPNVWPLGWKA